MEATIDKQDPEVLLLKRQELKLKAEKLRLLRRDGLVFYKPFAKQEAFHRSTAKRRGMFAGNRFGKSHLGCAEDSAWLRGERPWFPEGDPGRRSGIPQHPVKGLVITTDWDKVDEIWTSQRGEEGKLWRFLPRDGFIKRVQRNHAGVVATVECVNKSVLRFDTVKSWMANPQGSESSDWDFIHVDEPCPEGMFIAASRGLMDRNGSAWFTLTPLKEPWITDAFSSNGSFANSMWYEYGATYDNPYLSKEAIEAFEATLTEEEKECRLHGKPLHLAGLIYKEFSWAKHVLSTLPSGWRDFATPPKDWSHYFYIDPHPQTPHCVLFCVVDPLGRRYYYNDLFVHCSISSLAGRIKEVLKDRNVIRGRIDPIAYVNDPLTESNMAEEFAKYGVIVEKATKALSQGILRVQGELGKEPSPIRFSPEARRTLWEIQRYHWDEKENKPVDKDDHAMECLYRAELDEPVWVDPRNMNTAIDDEVIPVRPRLDLSDISFST